MSIYEFMEWQAYYDFDPFGNERGDLQAALISCVIANANRDGISKVFKIEDFMLKFGPQRQQTPQEFAAIMQTALVAARRGRGSE